MKVRTVCTWFQEKSLDTASRSVNITPQTNRVMERSKPTFPPSIVGQESSSVLFGVSERRKLREKFSRTEMALAVAVAILAVLFVVFLVLFLKAECIPPARGWINIGSGCVGARNDQYKEITYNGSNFFIGAVRFVHKSKHIGCDASRKSKWGCGWGKPALAIIVTDEMNRVIYPRLGNATKGYKLPGFTSSSRELILADFGNPTYLKYGDKLRIWYKEDLYNSTENDNHGKTCMDIYVYKLAV